MGAGQFIQPELSKHNSKYHFNSGNLIPSIHRKKVMLSCFEGDWTLDYGSGVLADDTINYRFGTKSLKITPVEAGTDITVVRKNFSPALNLSDKIGVLKCFIDNSDNVYEIIVNVFVENTPGYTKYLDMKWNTFAVRSGWNNLVFKASNMTTFGGAKKSFTGVNRVKVKVSSKDGATLNVSFDALYFVDDLNDKGKVILTFDDNNITDFTVAKPRMDIYGFPGCSFVITSQVGTQSYYTDVAQLQQMYECGWDICSHTVTHPNLTTLDLPDLQTELRNSYKWLIANGFYRSARFIASPGGQANATVLSEIAKIYQAHRGIKNGVETIPCLNQYDLKVRYIGRDYASLTTAKGYLDSAEANKHVAICVFHKLEETPSTADNWAIADFNAFIDYLATKNVDVITLSDLIMYEPNLLDSRIEDAW